MSAVKRVKSSKRPNFADEFKRALIEQTFEPDASVSLVARCNDINTNLLFRWRRQYLEGAFGPPRPEHVGHQKPTDGIPTLLPVSIVDESKRLRPAVRLLGLIECIVVPTKFFSGNQSGRDVGGQTREVE
ncbi:transposase, partial [Burkholderia ubonensis]